MSHFITGRKYVPSKKCPSKKCPGASNQCPFIFVVQIWALYSHIIWHNLAYQNIKIAAKAKHSLYLLQSLWNERTFQIRLGKEKLINFEF